MVNDSSRVLDSIFSALADPTRRAILERLSHGRATVSEVAAPFQAAMSLQAVSKHLRVLEAAGLIVRHKAGRIHHLELAATPMKDAAEWLNVYRQFWDAQFDSLAQFLRDQQDEGRDDQSPTGA